ncbi:hypothetical protein C7293_22595 [filamentous cyanobacterium CCT1]|nr:hypothetical protein C7293_22595 [filamentous cyanobacterium CCT1]
MVVGGEGNYIELNDFCNVTEVNAMTTEENKSYAEKNEERIQNFVDNIDEKGAEKKEQKKEAFENAKESE